MKRLQINDLIKLFKQVRLQAITPLCKIHTLAERLLYWRVERARLWLPAVVQSTDPHSFTIHWPIVEKMQDPSSWTRRDNDYGNIPLKSLWKFIIPTI